MIILSKVGKIDVSINEKRKRLLSSYKSVSMSGGTIYLDMTNIGFPDLIIDNLKKNQDETFTISKSNLPELFFIFFCCMIYISTYHLFNDYSYDIVVEFDTESNKSVIFETNKDFLGQMFSLMINSKSIYDFYQDISNKMFLNMENPTVH